MLSDSLPKKEGLPRESEAGEESVTVILIAGGLYSVTALRRPGRQTWRAQRW